MTASIHIVTFLPDLRFFQLCARSITKWATGWDEVVVVVPTRDYEHFESFSSMETPDGAPFVVRHRYESLDRGHLWMNATRLGADIYCPHADMIAHVDSDSVLTDRLRPDDYLDGARIRVLTLPYAESGDAQVWKPLVDLTVGWDEPTEFMQSPMLAHWRETYATTRAHIEMKHRQPALEYALTNHVPEFDTLGSIAAYFGGSRYRFIDRRTPEGVAWRNSILQGWSFHRQDAVAFEKELARLEAAIG